MPLRAPPAWVFLLLLLPLLLPAAAVMARRGSGDNVTSCSTSSPYSAMSLKYLQGEARAKQRLAGLTEADGCMIAPKAAAALPVLRFQIHQCHKWMLAHTQQEAGSQQKGREARERSAKAGKLACRLTFPPLAAL
jgi:hypothetical protein